MKKTACRFSTVKERLGKTAFGTAALLCVVAVTVIFLFLFIKSIPALQKIGVFDFLFGNDWSPDRYDTYDAPLAGRYGILPMIIGTLAATAGALLIGGIPGYFTAVFLSFFCPKRLRGAFTSVIHLLAGIPSVVYGFFGIAFVLPLLSRFAPNNGTGLLATSIILGIMILPTVVALSRTALDAVPRAYYEGAVAMGATHPQAVFGVCVPAARSGLMAALVLGAGRSLGETMAVVMVAGNSPTYPTGLFQSFRVLTANIVMEMGYAGQVQEGALIATGAVLLVFVFLVNVLFQLISKKTVTAATGAISVRHRIKAKTPKRPPQSARLIAGYRALSPKIGALCAKGAGVGTAAVLLLLLGFIFIKGLPPLVSDPHLLFGAYSFDSERITLLPAIITTLMTVLLSLLIAVPVSVATAVYLNEYANRKSRRVRIIRTAIDILGGVPSIVYGLFGMITFVRLITGSGTIFAGSLTVSMMLLPVIVRATEESLASVPDIWRAGSFALGAGKLYTVWNIVLPSALPGILSAVILAMGRVTGESAPFIYTMGSVISAVPSDYLDSGATLAVALYRLAGEGWHLEQAYACAVVLVFLVLLLNGLANVLAAKLDHKSKGEHHVKRSVNKKARQSQTRPAHTTALRR